MLYREHSRGLKDVFTFILVCIMGRLNIIPPKHQSSFEYVVCYILQRKDLINLM